MSLVSNLADQPPTALKSAVECGFCEGHFHVVPEDGIAYCPDCEAPHFCTDYYLKPFREAGL